MDTTPPEIPNCPGDIEEIIELGAPNPTISWIIPSATDLSGASIVSSSHDPGTTFQIGETVVTYIFGDPFGNTALCSFVVIVTTGMPL